MTHPSYLVIDVESVSDGELIGKLRYADEDLSPGDAVARYRGELMEKYGNDFVPYTYQIPVSVAVAKVDAEFRLLDLAALDSPQFRPHVITENFWRGWGLYGQPTLVTFNGRGFDMPLLELAAFRYGLSLPGWFSTDGPAYEQSRNRYNLRSHVDLQELLTNHRSTRFTGGLNLAANLLGKPGKMSIEGQMVQSLYDSGQVAQINDYCRCDVLDTFFVFLRSRVLTGQLSLEREQQIVAQTKEWLQESAAETPVYQKYLDEWGDWRNPWQGDGVTG